MERLGKHFSTRDAQRAGVTRQRLRRVDLQAPHHGVRSTRTPSTLVERCHAFLPAMTSTMLFSHVTAARLHGLPLPGSMSTDLRLHVSTIAPGRAIRHRGVCGHQVRLSECDIRFVHALPVPAPVETWCQLATLLSEEQLVIAGDALVRRKEPLASLEEIRNAVDRATCRPGIRRLRLAAARLRPRTDSPMETLLREALMSAGLPEPRVNYALLAADGSVAAHGDLVYPAARLVIEYDGDHHRTDERQYHIDVDRLWRIQALGWKVLRINKTHLTAGAAEAVRRVADALTLDSG